MKAPSCVHCARLVRQSFRSGLVKNGALPRLLQAPGSSHLGFTKLLLPNACSKRSIAKFFNSPSGDVITIHKKVKYKNKKRDGKL